MPQFPALLLIGPTGSGKTPLGDRLAEQGVRASWLGLAGDAIMPTLHFDFGAELRAAVEAPTSHENLSGEDVAFLEDVLQRGALLEDERFGIARSIFESFAREHDATSDTAIVMNGLPRHVGQAEAVAAMVDVRAIVWLECDAKTVLRRLASDVGGDRAVRDDDHETLVRAKLATYAERTRPLVDYYIQRGARRHVVRVTPTMTAADAYDALAAGERHDDC